jgi:hypothetical protein
VISALCLAAGGTVPLDVQALLKEREHTLAGFHDSHRSPLSAVARYDFQKDKPLTIGSAPDNAVVLDGLAPHAMTIVALADHFEIDGNAVPPGTKVPLGHYVLRLSHQNFPGVVVFDVNKVPQGPFPRWFAPDPGASVEATLIKEPPREEIVLSTRGNKRRALRLGKLRFTYAGQQHELTALRLLEPGTDEAAVSIFFRDATTGHETYPVGRYVDAEPLGADRYALDFNRAYNPTCAFSELYNCPIPPRENVLRVAVRAGERDPHAAD